MNKEKKSGYKTLLLSVVLSSPGPLILGYGLTLGRSSTQISDFTRRTAELLALIAAFVVYTITNKEEGRDAAWKSDVERKKTVLRIPGDGYGYHDGYRGKGAADPSAEGIHAPVQAAFLGGKDLYPSAADG